MLEDAQKAWLRRKLGAHVRFDEPMDRHTSFQIGGPADAWVQPGSEAELKTVLAWTQKKDISYLLIGGGTNVLVRDGGIRGLVIHLGRLADKVRWVQQGRQVRIWAGAGVATKHMCALALKHGWQGMNFALGIPGSLGGAIMMNAGTAHGCLADVIDSVMVMTASGEKIKLQRQALSYQYRRLQLPEDMSRDPASPAVLMAAQICLTRGDREQIRQQARQWMQGRARKQPAWEPGAGCFFKNPAHDLPAGRLIDEAGLKGYRVGGARVSPRHANFIINLGGASAADVLTIMAKIQETVKFRFDIDLVPEVHIVGEEKTGA
jgi:UDP-N-acetylmuramate dehydrogenase